MYKAKHDMLPRNIQSFFDYGASHHYNTRQKDNFVLKLVRTTSKSMCVSVTGPKLWNSLELSIQMSRNIYIFKRKLKQKYIQEYSEI